MELDPQQSEVASAEPFRRQVVIAGPGAGKTQVVSALVENLVLDQGVEPTHGLLVLSFSNAAIHAVDARLRARGAPPVHVRTIDSLAARIVKDASDDEVDRMTFAQRIVRATELVDGGEWYDADDLEHLVVDEVQDVVGVRADFLLAVINAIPADAGMTLLGDPAQAIYDFQLEHEGESDTTAAQLLEQARAVGARTVVLRGQYRASTRDARAAAGLRGEGEVAHHHDVEDFWNEVIQAGDLATAADLVRSWQESTVFLTSTNGQALVVAGQLRSLGLDVGIRRGAQQRVLASWIARCFGDLRAPSLTVEEFDPLLRGIAPGVDPAAAWRAIKGVAGSRGREVDLVALASALDAGRSVPPDLLETQGTQGVVSTVHRAKGLEFDNVFLVEFPSGGDERKAEERIGRERFVALTRARKRLARIVGPDTRWVRTVHGESGPRWIWGGHKPWMTAAFEVKASDVDPEISALDSSAQECLLAAVGAEVSLVPSATKSSLTVPIYEVSWNGMTIATMSEQFGREFAVRTGNLEQRKRGWPCLREARVESLASVVGNRSGSGNGFALAPVLSGLARIEWGG